MKLKNFKLTGEPISKKVFSQRKKKKFRIKSVEDDAMDRKFKKAAELLNESNIAVESSKDLQIKELEEWAKNGGVKPTSKKTERFVPAKNRSKKNRSGGRKAGTGLTASSKNSLRELLREKKSEDLRNIMFLQEVRRDILNVYDEGKEELKNALVIGLELIDEHVSDITVQNAEFAKKLVSKGFKEEAKYVLLTKQNLRSARRVKNNSK